MLFESIDAWLGHLGLRRYNGVLAEQGIIELFQVLSVTEEVIREDTPTTIIYVESMLFS